MRGVGGLCLTAMLCLTAACTGGPAPEQRSVPSSSYSGPGAVQAVDQPRQGPQPPREGAYFGAWVSPEKYTQPGRVQAVEDFERLVGRELDIVHLYEKWDAPFPSRSDRAFLASDRIVMISWAGTDTRVIASGGEDDVIRRRAREFRAIGAPVLLRWRWEMDRPNLAAQVWSPQDYVAAWKHIRSIFAEEGVSNVGWVWCPHARGFIDPERDAPAYYPGDEHVDWLCADVYAEPEGDTFAAAAGAFLQWAARHPKPIVIGEFGVQRGDRAAWFDGAFDVVREHPQIKALVYFAGVSKNERRYDHSLERSPAAVEVFRRQATSPYFDVRREDGDR